MRARGPYEVKPRQLRALVLLLALLPLLPMTFVIRFVVDDLASKRLEARGRSRPVYQKLLDAISAALADETTRLLPGESDLSTDDPWRALIRHPEAADTVLIASHEGRLTLPPLPEGSSGAVAIAQEFARSIIDSGVHYAMRPPSGPVRWRFLGETPEPLFSLHPRGAASQQGTQQPTLVLIKSRQHLLEKLGTYYQRQIDPQTALRLLDENGESVPLVGQADAVASGGGEPLGETLLPPPLPAWRVQLFGVDSSLVDGVAREQIAFYWWSVGAMVAVTAVIAAAAGWALTQRISLHELSNDALAVVSHEMKTPLASMRLLIETLLERRYRGGEAQAEEYLRLVAGENTRLERLVESFQTLSRLEHPLRGRSRLALEPVRADEIAEAARTRLGSRLDTEACDFRIEIDGEPPMLQADREALTAVLVNLLDNALKYSGDEKRIRLRVAGRDGRIVFEVSDNGQGIEPDEQSRIFERFYQSDSRLSRSHEGCGLGLSIVRSVVKAHGGFVAVKSAPGKGSTFTVDLPVKEAAKDGALQAG